MKDLTGQVTGGELTAQSFNTGIAQELKNLVQTYAGITMREDQQQQLVAALNAKWSDINCANTVVNSNSKVSDEHCANTDFELGTTSSTLTKYIIDVSYPIGSIFVSGQAGLFPPGHSESQLPISGVTWEDSGNRLGHLLVIAQETGDWAVSAGQVAGDRQVTNPMGLNNLISHTHNYFPDGSVGKMLKLGGTQNEGYSSDPEAVDEQHSATQPTGQANPDGIGLSNLQRYGVLIWKRTA